MADYTKLANRALFQALGVDPANKADAKAASQLLSSNADVQIRKAGFERFVALAAQRHGFLYGLSAVLLSLVLGYGASAIFRRR